MARQLFVTPEEVRAPGTIPFRAIPVNQYQKKPSEEKDRFSKDDFLRIYQRHAPIPNLSRCSMRSKPPIHTTA
jgi:hypothetical protein